MKDRELSFSQHLRELRKRLIIATLSLLVSTSVAFAFHKQILLILLRPGEGLFSANGGKPVFIDPTEFFGVAMKVSLLAGLVIALPMIIYQLVMFVAPALTPKERRYLFIFLPFSVLVFVAGGAFGYLALFPVTVRFLLTFGSDVATPMIRIGNYINLMITLLFWIGLIFEIPPVLFLLAKLGIVNSNWLARQRRYVLVLAFVLGAIITPTFDPVNQSIVAVPIILLYEAGIWLAKLARRPQPKTTGELAEPLQPT